MKTNEGNPNFYERMKKVCVSSEILWLLSHISILAIAIFTMAEYSNYWDKRWRIDIMGTIVPVSVIIIVACIYKIYGKTIIPKSGTIVQLLGISTLIVMLGNSEINDFPGQIFPSLMMTIGCICLAYAFLWRYASIILFAVFFEETIRKGCYLWLDVPFNAHVLSAISRASKSEVLSYLNIYLIGGIALAASIICVLIYALRKKLTKEKRITIFLIGLLAISGCYLSRQILIPHICNRASGKWPTSGVVSFIKESNSALSINRRFTSMVRELPSAADGSSIRTLQGNEGVICILHIGESLRADRLSINGYSRTTTPWLQRQSELINYKNCVSSAPETIQSLITILTNGRYLQENRTSDLYLPSVGSIVDLFSANGFTALSFWSQGAISAPNDPTFTNIIMGLTKGTSETVQVPGLPIDQARAILVRLKQEAGHNVFVLTDNIGSHTPFYEYDENDAPFQPSDPSAINKNPRANSEMHIRANNAYDNTVHHTDRYIQTLIEGLAGKPFIYIYIGDHGEYIGDDGLWGRGKVMNDPVMYYNTNGCMVPLLMYASPEFIKLNPHFNNALKELRAHMNMVVAHEYIFHTLIGIFGIESQYYDESLDLSSPNVKPYTGPQPANKGMPADTEWH